jgi:pimeloyl-ACP methyl ester carboxylesterase
MRPAAAVACILLAACAAAPDRRGPVRALAVPVDAGTIHVETRGDGATVLLIHGGFGDRRMWDAQFDALASRYRVARMDLRGYGGSSFPDAPYSPVADVVAVLDALGASRAHLVGNSMGGALALDVALAHPQRVASLTVVASGPNGYPPPAERARFAAEIETIVAVFRAASEQGLEQAAALWKTHPMVHVAYADPRTRPLLERMIDDNRRVFRMQFWPDDDKSAVDRLADVRTPTLLVVGDRDIAIVRAAADYAAQRIPGARLVVLPGTDHLPQMEAPDAFNRLVVAFIAGESTR